MSEPVRVLLVTGSTRAGSGNTAALATAAAVAPRRVTAVMYDGLARLPAFNPDDDGDRIPVDRAAVGPDGTIGDSGFAAGAAQAWDALLDYVGAR